MPPATGAAAAAPAAVRAPVVRPSLQPAENALVCYLRLHPSLAATYGIRSCDGNTSIGSMLMQSLESQGMNVAWYERLPADVPAANATMNQKAAAWIKSVTRRPGARMKPLSERPEVAPPDRSAVQRAHGRLPRVAFPLLVKLSKQRRDRKFTSCGNRQWPLAQTMLVERPRLVDWVEKQCACRHCGKRLRLSKLTSHQVGVCARVHFVCEKGCVRLKALETSTTMHGDAYQLNTRYLRPPRSAQHTAA